MAVIRRARIEDAPAVAQCHIESWKDQFFPIMTPGQIALKDLDLSSQTQLWQGRLGQEEEGYSRYTFVAEDQGAVAGYISGGPDRDSGLAGCDSELYQIYVLPTAQGRGFGRQLVITLTHQFIELGFRQMCVWVVTTNPALHFYQDTLSAVPTGKRRCITEVDGGLIEEAYLWAAIESLSTSVRQNNRLNH